MTALQWTVVAGGTVLGAAAMFLLTWLPVSLWRPPAADGSSRRIADRFVLRAATLVAVAVLLCGAIALGGAAAGLPYGAVEALAVSVLPAGALLLAEFVPIRASVARGSVLRPRRRRDLGPGVLFPAAVLAAFAATALQAAVVFLGSQRPGSERANHWGLACRLPETPQWPGGFETTPLVSTSSWTLVVAVAFVPAQLAAVAVVAHCHRRASIVADPASDAGLRRCLATRSVAIAAVCASVAVITGASTLGDAAQALRSSAQPQVRWAAGVPTAPPAGIGDCVVSDVVERAWSAVGILAQVANYAGLAILLLAVACYCFPGRVPESAAVLPTVKVG